MQKTTAEDFNLFLYIEQFIIIYIYIYIYIYISNAILGIFYHDGVIFFLFLPKWGRLKKITKLGKSCQFDTTSYAQIVPIWHDSAMSYWSHVNLTRLLSCHTEVVSTWHDFCHVILKSCQLGTTSATSYFFILGSKLCNVKN